MIEKWVGKMADPVAEFKSIDLNGGGQILFDEFCDWSVQKNLDLDDDDDFEQNWILIKEIFKIINNFIFIFAQKEKIY